MDSRIRISRRSLLAGMLAAAPALAFTRRAHAMPVQYGMSEEQVRAALTNVKGTKLVLLGTGAGPQPGMNRHMQSSVLLHDGVAYVVDCGLGVTDLFVRTGIPFPAVRSIFITHHHPDHNVEYGPFLVLGWIEGLQQSVHAYGPPPLMQITQDYLRSMKVTIDFWAEDFKMRPLGMIPCTEISAAGSIMQDDNVKVRSVVVQHPPVRPALGYRFDFTDRSIAFSGDTVPLDAVAQLARGADVLVHEAMDMPGTIAAAHTMSTGWHGPNYDTIMQHMKADHSPTEAVGRIAHEAGVKLLVLSHLTPDDAPEEAWVSAASKYYKGPIVVGRDLMVI
jgi:ribonuclease BN (tRNA processing enzyme)